MATNLGTAYVSVMPSMKGFGAAVESGMSTVDTSKVGASMGEKASKGFAGGMAKGGAVIGAMSAVTTKAMDAVSASMDRAVARVDTMSNFPKVMKNLGISSDEAKIAINKVSDGLTGLPTALDAGVAAVQRFTSFNGDVNKSADMFLAVNDAILAGGAGAQMQASALEQLSQAYTKGKMDSQEWRTLQQAMPAQLKQVADAMGMTTEQLGDGLRQANKAENYLRDVPMDEFLEKIMELDKDGGAGFASFSEQAKDATTGIDTAMANLNTAIVRSVANVIDAIGQENISGAINAVGKAIGDIGKFAVGGVKEAMGFVEEHREDFEAIAGAIADCIPEGAVGKAHDFADGLADIAGKAREIADAAPGAVFDFLDDNKFMIRGLVDTLADVAPVALAAWGGVKAFEGGKAVFDKLTGIVGKTMGKIHGLGDKALDAGAKLVETGKVGAESMLSLSELLGGVTLGAAGLVAGVGLAIVGLEAYRQTMNNAAYEAAGLSDEQKAVVESAHAMMAEYDTLEKSRQNQIAVINAESDHVRELRDEYGTLCDESGNVKEGNEEHADQIKGELAQAFGIERDELDKTIEKYGDLGKAVDDTMEKQRLQKLLEAGEDQYSEAIMQKEELGKKYSDMLDIQSQKADEAAEKNKALGEAMEFNNETMSAEALSYGVVQYGDLANGAEGAADAVAGMTDELAGVEKQMRENDAYLKNYEGFQAALKDGDLEKANEWCTRYVNNIVSAEDATRESLESQVDMFQESYDKMAKAVENGDKSLEDDLKNMGKALELAKGELERYDSVELNEKFAKIQLEDGTLRDAQGNVYKWNGTKLTDKSGKTVVNDVDLVDAQGRVYTWNGTELKSKSAVLKVDTSSLEDAKRKWSGWSPKEKVQYVKTVIKGLASRGNHGDEAEMASGGFVSLHASGGFVTDGPTILGRDGRGVWHVAGEAGREWVEKHADGTLSVVPIENQKYLKPYANVIASMLSNQTGGDRGVQVFLNYTNDADASRIARDIALEVRRLELAGAF